MSYQPLAERLRPAHFDSYIGQEHLVGDQSVLRKMVESGNLQSIILWGPPGVGKTTLAKIIANSINREFFTLSAISSGVKDVRDVIEKAKSASLFKSQAAPVLFIDEIHRFSKAQQDSLLGAVEQGIVVLIGATTENPSFEVISPLLSRCQVYVLKSLTEENLLDLANRALSTDPVLKTKKIVLKETEALLRFSGGDARKLLNIIELIFNSGGGNVEVDNELIIGLLQQNMAMYDKLGEQHYDLISAFIKSVRGSDPNAAVYYLARMLKGGEDVSFIARRLVILASEDIGLANPNALLLATACFDAVNLIGMPEARIILSETTIYLATSPKSNASYMAIGKAMEEVDASGDLSVPLAIRNAPTSLMKNLGYGSDYLYAHDYDDHFAEMEFLPDTISGKQFYTPQDNAKENEIKHFLARRWKGKYGYGKNEK